MSRIDNLDGNALADLLDRVAALEKATPLSNTSVGRGRLRMYDGSELLIEDGNLSVAGTATVTGILQVTGQLNGDGTITWTGTTNLDGPVIIDGATTINGATTIAGPTDITGAATISGTANISGATTIGGAVTLNNNLTLGTGKIVAGVVTIDKAGGTGGRVVSTGDLFLVAAAGNSVRVSPKLVVSGDADVFGNQTVSGTKSFRMDHPTKPGWWIQHGSTESPISGTEYTGTGTFDAAGECVVTLPDYFEALNKPENRTAHITAIGRPFMVGAARVVGGKFTAYGQAGREFDWLVKAERFGGDFEVEAEKLASV